MRRLMERKSVINVKAKCHFRITIRPNLHLIWQTRLEGIQEYPWLVLQSRNAELRLERVIIIFLLRN